MTMLPNHDLACEIHINNIHGRRLKNPIYRTKEFWHEFPFLLPFWSMTFSLISWRQLFPLLVKCMRLACFSHQHNVSLIPAQEALANSRAVVRSEMSECQWGKSDLKGQALLFTGEGTQVCSGEM